MPGRHALSAKRGLPPLGFALTTGINGSTTSHSPSDKSSMSIRQPPSVGMLGPFPWVAGELRFCSKAACDWNEVGVYSVRTNVRMPSHG